MPVAGPHDIHAWSITSGYGVLSAHVAVDTSTRTELNDVLHRVRSIGPSEFCIVHTTIQLEESAEGCAESHHIAHDEGSTPEG